MNPGDYRISTDFLDCSGRRLFVVVVEPETAPVRGAVLFLPPFGDEMHKSRRTVAQQARAMAAAGYVVMLLDLSGSGDSSGLFAEANWESWIEDATCALSALAARAETPVVVWGLRFGALLACDLAQNVAGVGGLLMWQPTLNGEQYIDQFLRFELAGLALKGESGFDRAGLWNELRSGRSLEVAGYELSSRLGMDISHIRLGDLKPACPVVWIDIGRPVQSQASVASRGVISGWQAKKVPVKWLAAEGDSFWRNVDASDSPLLLGKTLEILADT